MQSYRMSCRTLRWFVRDDNAKSARVRIIIVSRSFVLTDKQVLRWCGGGSLMCISGVRRLGRVVWTSLDHLLDMFRLDIDRHRSDDAAWRWTRHSLEAHWARVCHTHVQLAQRFWILRSRHSKFTAALEPNSTTRTPATNTSYRHH